MRLLYMDYGLPDSSAAPEGEEELVGKMQNIVVPDLNSSLGNVAIVKDRYTDKRLIIKVSLTEVLFIRRKGIFPLQRTKRHQRSRVVPSRDSGGRARYGDLRRRRQKQNGRYMIQFPSGEVAFYFACVCQPKLFLQFSANFACIYHRSQWLL